MALTATESIWGFGSMWNPEFYPGRRPETIWPDIYHPGLLLPADDEPSLLGIEVYVSKACDRQRFGGRQGREGF